MDDRKIIKGRVLSFSENPFDHHFNFNFLNIDNKYIYVNNDQIEFTINNPLNKNITNLQFKIDNNLVSSPFLLNNNLGKNILKASFNVDDKEYTLKKEFIIYSSIKPKIYTYEIINEFSHDMNSYTHGEVMTEC